MIMLICSLQLTADELNLSGLSVLLKMKATITVVALLLKSLAIL